MAFNWLTGIPNNVDTDLAIWRTSADTRLEDLTKNKVTLDEYKKDKKEYDIWKTSTDTSLEDLLKTKITVDNFESDQKKLKDLLMKRVSVDDYEKDKKEYDTWKTSTDTRIGGLLKNKVSVTDFKSDQDKVNNRIRSVRADLQEFKDVAVPHLTDISGMSYRMKKLEGRAAKLEERVDGHDGRFKTYDAEFDKVRKEIQKGNEELGNQGKTLEKISAKLDREQNTGRWQGPSNGSAGSSFAPYVFNPYVRNDRSPGSISVANYGTLIHATNCPHRHHDDTHYPYVFECSCKSLLGFSYGTPKARLLPALLPAPREPPSYERRTRRNSDSRHGNSNFNFTPYVRLGLERSTSGGLFSKPKMEAISFDLGRGGGGGVSGRSKHRSGSSHLMS